METETLNLLTLIISIIAIMLSFSSFLVSLFSYLSDEYKLKIGVDYGLTGEFEPKEILVISIANKGKRPVSISNFYFENKKGNLSFYLNFTSDIFYNNFNLPSRIDEKESLDIYLDFKKLENAIKETGYKFNKLVVVDKTGRHHKKKIKKFN